MSAAALDDFKKADKKDDRKCLACQKKMIEYGVQLGDWKAAETAGKRWWPRRRARKRPQWPTIS